MDSTATTNLLRIGDEWAPDNLPRRLPGFLLLLTWHIFVIYLLRCFLIEIKQSSRAQQPLDATVGIFHCSARTAGVYLPPLGAGSCCTVSARPNVLMEQQFCVSLLCKLFWQSLYAIYIYRIYMEHVCCPIDRQIAPLISQAGRTASCQSMPCLVVPSAVAPVSHIS